MVPRCVRYVGALEVTWSGHSPSHRNQKTEETGGNTRVNLPVYDGELKLGVTDARPTALAWPDRSEGDERRG